MHNSCEILFRLLKWSESFSVMSDSFVTPCTVALQAPLSMGFSREEYWSGLPFPFPGDLPSPGINQTQVSCIAGGFFTSWATRELLGKASWRQKCGVVLTSGEGWEENGSAGQWEGNQALVDGWQQASKINSKSTMMTQKHDNLTLSPTRLESCFHTFSSNAFLSWFNNSQANVFFFTNVQKIKNVLK